jgi:carbamoyl-phosphate synthase large subunit
MKILLLGSGALKIGQAGEFDYSGSQAIKALKEEGHNVILANPNIATIQTSQGFANKVFFVPVEPYFIEQIIKSEKPDGILLSFGGQTALNCGLELERNGTLDKFKVKVLGTPVGTIEKTEDRDLFNKSLKEIKANTPQSYAVKTQKEAVEKAAKIGYPVMVRSAFSLGGQDSGIANNKKELTEIASRSFSKVNQILVEEYLKGWKEIEYEIVRDKFDNCIAVCNMENIDPMGIHTGESIVVAPSQTLNNFEYHGLRQIALKVIRHLGVVGECNIQYALNPNPKTQGLDYRIIEVNARLSRSSALASKATGYPLAYVAAKIALGQSLTEIKNSVTKKTIACFEPALDYLIVKFPRWDLTKFVKSTNIIGTSMQSVGEVMAIGRKFEEAIQKASRMLDIDYEGIIDEKSPSDNYKEPTPWRLFAIAKAIKEGVSTTKIAAETGIDEFFLEKIKNIADFEKTLSKSKKLEKEKLKKAKQLGFSDSGIARLTGQTQENITLLRNKLKLHPSVKQIDTLAAEYPAQTNYLYLTYNGDKDDLDFKSQTKSQKSKVIILGSGPYRIGSSVEFDWCSVTSAESVSQNGFDPIIINCNPETVSTDFDMAKRLYFEELSEETVMEIYKKEKPLGIIVSMGGQKPNNLTPFLAANGVNILGTSPKSIDMAEDRNKFSALCDNLGIDQPPWATLKTVKEALRFAQNIEYPVLVRPSYVLSGAAMNVAFNSRDLEEYLTLAANISDKYPVVISKFIQNAKELEVDAVAKNGQILASAVSEHVENAGVHSGDSTIVLPAQKLYMQTVKQVEEISGNIAKTLHITGPFNIQFIAINNNIQVIECNLRASRSLPFVSKVTGINFARVATESILGVNSDNKVYKTGPLNYVGVKAPQFSFSRIKGADPILRVEMASTGEVACFGKDTEEAFLKSIVATGMVLPKKSVFISLAGEENKIKFLESAKIINTIGLKIFATAGTSAFLEKHAIPNQKLYKIHEKKNPNILNILRTKKIDLVINIFDPYFKKEFDDDYLIRRNTVDYGIPLITNLQTAELFIKSIFEKKPKDLETKSWDTYVKFLN